MYIYVARPEGEKYPLCTNGTAIGNGSGLCMNVTSDLIDSATTLLTELPLEESLLDTEEAPETPPDWEGKDIRSCKTTLNEWICAY